MTGDASVLGSLHSVDGEGVVRMEDRLDAGIDDVWGALIARAADRPRAAQRNVRAARDCPLTGVT